MTIRAALWITLLWVMSHCAFACDFRELRPAVFSPSNDTQAAKPRLAKARVESIVRGNARNLNNSCSDTGVLTIYIVADGRAGAYAFSFEVSSGESGDFVVQKGPIEGVVDRGEGAYVFVLPWLDGATQEQEPLNFRIRITPYDRFGRAGLAKELTVEDPGRPEEAGEVVPLATVAGKVHAKGVGMAQVCYVDFYVETLTPVTVENICSRGDVRNVPLSAPSLLRITSLLERSDRNLVSTAVRLRTQQPMAATSLLISTAP